MVYSYECYVHVVMNDIVMNAMYNCYVYSTYECYMYSYECYVHVVMNAIHSYECYIGPI